MVGATAHLLNSGRKHGYGDAMMTTALLGPPRASPN